MGVNGQLRIDVRHEADRVIIRLEGELDLANASRLQSTLEEADLGAANVVVMDLQGLQFIDSTGLREVLSLRGQTLQRGGEFAVTPGSQQVQRLLSVTGVADHLRTLDTPDELTV